MLLLFLLKLFLMIVTLLVVVPAVTGGGVAVRKGGIFRGLLTLMVVGLLNFCLWLVFTLFTVGGALVANYLTFGLVGILVNALAFKCSASAMPEVLYVRSYGSAFWASIVMTIMGCLIQAFIQ